MASPTEQAIRDILREAGRPMTAAEIGELLATRVTLKSKRPADSVRNALSTYHRTCVNAGRGVYAYLPSAVNGAAIRVPLRLVAAKGWRCAVGSELAALLWPGTEDAAQRTPKIALEDGPTIDVTWPKTSSYSIGWVHGPLTVLKLDEPFWHWWEERRRTGDDHLLVRCEDGEAGRYTATTVRSGALDAAAVEEANQAVREAAANALRGSDRGYPFWHVLGRILARGAYHRDVPADPLSGVLLLPVPRFLYSGFDRLEHRPDLTPGLADLFQDRLLLGWALAEQHARELLRLPVETHQGAPTFDPLADLGEREPAPAVVPPASTKTEIVQAVRLKVALQWMPEVWRTIEIREDQSLEDLHDAIQDAFGWDDDHLYSFFLSGQPWDKLTEVTRPTGFDADLDLPSFFQDFEPIYAHEVAIADLEPEPKQQVLYLFDFGDELGHDLTVLSLAPADGGEYPRIVETHGEAPPQYPTWDEGDEGDEGDEDWVIDVAAEEASAPFPIGQSFPLGPGGAWTSDVEVSPIDADPSPAARAAVFESLFDLLGIERPRYNDLARFELPEPDPALRRLPIDLNGLVPAIAAVPELPFRLDTETGDIVLAPNADTPAARSLRERIESNPDRYVPLPTNAFVATPDEMAAFAETVDDPTLRGRLLAAARGKAPQIRFQRELSRHEPTDKRWNESLQRRLLGRTLDWLAGLGIAPEPPSPPTKPGKKSAADKHKRPTSKRAAKRRKG